MMGKFKDIKMGDEVLVCVEIKIPWGLGKGFYCLKKVEYTTNTQFIIEGVRYKKKDGFAIGRYREKALSLGDKSNNYNEDIVKDETKEMNLFIKKKDIWNAVCNIEIQMRNVSIDTDITLLKEALTKADELQSLVAKMDFYR